jgi:hypothetical protein
MELRRAFLDYRNRRYEQAMCRVQWVRMVDPANPGASDLFARIQDARAREDAPRALMRRLRFMLGLNAAWKRWMCILFGVGCLAYGFMHAVPVLPRALRGDMDHVVWQGTRVSYSRYRFGRSYYTRVTVRDEVLVGGIMALIGLSAVVIPLVIGRGAQDWEELYDTSETGYLDGGLGPRPWSG